MVIVLTDSGYPMYSDLHEGAVLYWSDEKHARVWLAHHGYASRKELLIVLLREASDNERR